MLFVLRERWLLAALFPQRARGHSVVATTSARPEPARARARVRRRGARARGARARPIRYMGRYVAQVWRCVRKEAGACFCAR